MSLDLTYDVTTINLPSPVFSDKKEIQVQRIQRSTKGGDLITYRDSNWSKNEIWKLAFDSLEDDVKDDLKNLIEDSLGQEVTIEYSGITYTCLIVNPNGNFSEVVNLCGHTFELWVMILSES